MNNTSAIELVVHKISAKVSRSKLDPESSTSLQTGWVRLSGIPSMAKTEEVVKLIVELVGKVVCVDEVSLIKDEPVRVKPSVRDISKIRGYVEVFIGKTGYEIRFVPELPGGKSQAPNDKPPKKT